MSPLRLPQVAFDPEAPFPDPCTALREPDGLLAMGGDLSPARLLNAYRHGIFPWFSDGQPILWWSPDPRVVFDTAALGLTSRMKRQLRQVQWSVRADTCFEAVIDACSRSPRPGQSGTWITRDMRDAYIRMHGMGYAHSIEVLADGALVGGLYGLAIGRMFFAESMVSLASGGSKVALAALGHRLAAWGWPLIDAQVENAHLSSLGARLGERDWFLTATRHQVGLPATVGPWTDPFGTLHASDLAPRISG